MADFKRKAAVISRVVHAIEHGVFQPLVNGGLAPASTALTDADLSWECAVADLAVKGRTGEPGSLEHGLDPDDPIGSVAGREVRSSKTLKI
jgi:hypothetical protein